MEKTIVIISVDHNLIVLKGIGIKKNSSMFEKLWSLLTLDIGIDLGTATTLVTVKGQGVIIHEPSVVAMNSKTKQILAVGSEARRMIGRTPANIVAVRPLRGGVVSDFDMTHAMIRHFIEEVFRDSSKAFKIPRPRVVIGVPSTVTEVERKAVIDAAISAGARKAYIIEEPMAAAIGAGLPVMDASGSMVIDIGGGTTDIAVISLGGIVVDKTIRLAGDQMDSDIVNYVRQKYHLLIGERTAEDIKIAIGSAHESVEDTESELSGRDLVSGLPRTIKITSSEVREALSTTIAKITDAAKDAVEETPPELLSDLIDDGIILAGGGGLLRGLDKHLAERLNIPVKLAERPISCVAEGCGVALEEIELLNRIQITSDEII